MSERSLSEAEYDAVTQAAAHWCLRLQAVDCTPTERQAFEQWRDAHPLHALEYEAMLEIRDVSEHLLHTEIPQVPVLPTPHHRWRAYSVAAAISLMALPLAAFTGWNLGWLPSSREHFQAQSSVRQITLADGSQVELNLGSELTYSNYKDQRRITLNKGEAFFNVSHDPEHPFVVKAADGYIRVTGTRFNVWKYEDSVRVTLLEGSVLVSSHSAQPNDGVRLDPGMQANFKAGDYSPQVSQTHAADTSLAWRSGKLILDDLALVDALPLINRYLGKPVMLADNATGAMRISGIYDINEVKGLVTSLPKVLPVYLTRNKDGNPVLNPIPRQAPKS